MSQNNSTAGASGKEQTAGLLLAELQEKLARYDTLEHEISKLGQEQTTLENYVKNLMDSDHSRAKNVNYYEETLGDSDESDFQLTEDEEAPKKRTKTRSSKQTKSIRNDKAQGSDIGFGGHADAQSFSGSDTESDKSSKFMQGDKSVKSAESNRDAKPESEPTLYIEPTPPDSRDGQKTADLSPDVRETNGAESSSLSSVESDVYEEEDSDNDSDFSGDGPFVVITKTARHTGKGTAVAAKATSKKSPISNVKAAAPVKTANSPVKTVKPPVKITKSPVQTVKTASTPFPKPAVSAKPGRNAALGSLLSSPTSPRPARPKLHSSGSSLSSLSSNGLSTHSPNGTKRKAPGASLKDLLKGSSVPRAGISRRTLLKKVA
ncbi:hypothetical protein IWW49_004607 [Coemansia sp. RSA 1797]|nr:hypothetical protein IWW49_004607 [Coemansia sp. RSA 1797]